MTVGEGIRAFFDRYAARYMAFDVDAVAAMYHVPFLAVREGRPIHLADGDSVRRHLAGLMQGYRDAGAVEAAVAGLEVTPLGAGCALATVWWRALSADGVLLREFTTSYLLLGDAAGGWRILGYVYHA